MCGCEFILELSDAMQKLGVKALVVDIRHHWRSRRNENSSRIFFGFVPCVCDFEMTVNSVRVTTHILCVLLFFGTCRALLCPTRLSLFLSWRNLSSSYSIFLLFALAFFFLFLCFLCLDVVFNSNFMTWVECKIREFRRSEREMHFISLPRSTVMRLFEIFFVILFMYTEHIFHAVLCCLLLLTLNFILTFEWKDSNWTIFEWIASQFHKSHCW